MKLQAIARTTDKKKTARRLRREGMLPAVVYGGENSSQHIQIAEQEFMTLLRGLPKGRLATTKITIELSGEKAFPVLVKDIQYHPVTYRILHLDLIRIAEGRPLSVRVPVELLHEADCAGVKQGGALRKTMMAVPVRCLPKDLPEAIYLDVANLEMKQSKRLRDAHLPAGVTPLIDNHEVLAVVAKR